MPTEFMANDRFAGMTVNERLYEGSVMEDFDEAAKVRNRQKMISLLLQVELSQEQAVQTTDAILANPKKYGY